jgi:hypothetical protein
LSTQTNTNTDTNANSNNNTSQNDNNNLWLENLKKNECQRRKDSQWFSMQPGDKTVLEFLRVWTSYEGL